MKDKIIGIYSITNKTNNKKYIGQSKDILTRKRTHFRQLRNDIHKNERLQNSFNFYGEKEFLFEIVEESTLNDLNEREKYYINLFNTYNPRHGYNKTYGGESYSLTPEALEQYRAFRNEKFGLPIHQINFNGEVICTWESARTAARDLGIYQGCIYQCLVKNRKTYKGCIWIYSEEFDDTFDASNFINKNTQSRIVLKIDMTSKVVLKKYDSAHKAEEDGFDSSCIIKCCKNKRPHHKGFIWKFLE